jgi:peptidoglycan/LPS O-acetylase OafA/YrhL
MKIDQPLKRRDLEGLRALSIVLVFGYHLFPARLPGGFIGVDIFFVISGFLITKHLFRDFSQHRQVRLLPFYARRIRRLLPASFLVLLASVLVTALIIPGSEVVRFANGVSASSLYVANWFLAMTSSGYAQVGQQPSIVQQYWSLSVEEQFYIFWPLLFLAALFFFRKISGTKRDGRRVFPGVLLIIFFSSLLTSVLLTNENPAQTYFFTTTRAWEFALGGLVSFVPNAQKFGSDRLIKPSLIIVSWLALGALLSAAVLLSDKIPFPGIVALWPTLAAAILIYIGDLGTKWEPSFVSKFPPVTAIGGLSYGIYLWHWLVIVSFVTLTGDSPNLSMALSITGITLFLSILTKYWVENPLRFGPKIATDRRAFMFALVGSLIILLAAGSLSYWANQQIAVARAQPPLPLFSSSTEVNESIQEELAYRAFSSPQRFSPRSSPITFDCLDVDSTATVERCTFGSAAPSHLMVVVGDSYANSYIPGLIDGFGPDNWQIISLTRASCPAAVVEHKNPRSSESVGCVQHRDWALTEIERLNPELVIVANATHSELGEIAPQNTHRTVQEIWQAGLTNYLGQIEQLGPKIVVLGQTPVPNCRASELPSSCLDKTYPWSMLTAEQQAVQGSGIQYVDTRAWYCTQDLRICPEVVAGSFVTVSRSDSHLSDQYSRRLANLLYTAINEVK